MASNAVTKVTEEQYLALDRAAEFRSELLDGEIVAMSGGSMRHSKLQINLALEIDDCASRYPLPDIQLRSSRSCVPSHVHLPRSHGRVRKASAG